MVKSIFKLPINIATYYNNTIIGYYSILNNGNSVNKDAYHYGWHLFLHSGRSSDSKYI